MRTQSRKALYLRIILTQLDPKAHDARTSQRARPDHPCDGLHLSLHGSGGRGRLLHEAGERARSRRGARRNALARLCRGHHDCGVSLEPDHSRAGDGAGTGRHAMACGGFGRGGGRALPEAPRHGASAPAPGRRPARGAEDLDAPSDAALHCDHAAQRA